jgi:hypothetical protein
VVRVVDVAQDVVHLGHDDVPGVAHHQDAGDADPLDGRRPAVLELEVGHQHLPGPQPLQQLGQAAAIGDVAAVDGRHDGPVQPRVQAQRPLDQVRARLRERRAEHARLAAVGDPPGQLGGRQAEALERPPPALHPGGGGGHGVIIAPRMGGRAGSTTTLSPA